MAVVGYMNFKRFFSFKHFIEFEWEIHYERLHDNTAIRLIKRIRKKY